MKASADFVGPSRDGDQFHYHWAARRCLALLPGAGDLVAVTVEGSSPDEADEPIPEGEELIDVGMYYGSEAVSDARLVRYVQLKHSTRRVSEPWTTSGLKRTVQGFAVRYGKLRENFSFPELRSKLRFEFTTNRPIALNVKEALDDVVNSAPPRHPEICRMLEGYAALDGMLTAEFFQLLSVEGSEPGLWAQRELLAQDFGGYLAEADYDAPLQLKELVTRKATSEFATNRAIRKYDVLRAMKVSEDDLQPAPCQIAAPREVLLREQESEIVAALLTAAHPLVLHADSGVGKSVLALRLAASMPSGSEAVLYDCFGDGLYRNALNFRHRPRDALVQIANELAARSLCHPLIPSTHADVKQYLRAFRGRLEQAMETLRARDAQAHLCIVIDAADNAEMIAREFGERSFVRELIRMPLPPGVRLVFTCRTHRQELLDAPPDVVRIELKGFSQLETALHLRGTFAEATEADVAEFAYLTSANPRVQAMALAGDASLPEMLHALGPAPMTVDRAIGELLQRAVEKLKDRVGPIESTQIDLICRGLAMLRPLVPISILARVSDTSESAVRSFALDLGRPLLVKGNGLHFLDEPTETWFRERYRPGADEINQFVERLRPLAQDNAYVASTLPQLLMAVGRMDELVALALSTHDLPTHNPIERRDVELQRLLFALTACLRNGRTLDAVKLALKAGGEVAAEARHVKVLQQNTHIASALLAPDRLEELVARRTFPSTWMGSHHVYDAALLSGGSEFAAEARSRLRMACSWLNVWGQQPHEERDAEVSDDDRAEFAMAFLQLQGAGAAANFLRRWMPRHLAFEGGKQLGRRLVDLSRYDEIDGLAHAAGNGVWLLLGLAVAVGGVGRSLPAAPLTRLMRLLGDRRVLLANATVWSQGRDIRDAVRAAAVQAARISPQDAATHARILRRYLPPEPPASLADRFELDREPLLRAYAIEAALRGQSLALVDVATGALREQLTQRPARGRGHEAETFEHAVGSLLPWLVLAAEVEVGRIPPDLHDRIAAAADRSNRGESRDYQRRYHFRQTTAIQWLRILTSAAAIDPAALATYRTWIAGHGEPLWTGTLTAMSRLAARTPGLTGLALEFAAAAHPSLESSDEDAESRTLAYLDLARAVLPASATEAAALFARSVEIASRIGDENLERWSALLRLARAAAQRETPRPQSAYRLSRAAELTYQYVVRDKHFDWDETTESLTDLCGASALTVLSRWRDRRFGQAEELLPVAVNRLVERELLPQSTAVSLAGLPADWKRLRDLQRAVEAELSSEKKRDYLRVAYRYMRTHPHDAKTWRGLAALGRELDVELLDLDRLLSFHRLPEASGDIPSAEAARSTMPSDSRTPAWDSFFDGVDLTDPAALRAAYAQLRTYDPPYQLEAFFREAFQRVGMGRATDFVNAVARWPDFEMYELRLLLDAVLDAAPKMLSLRTAIREAVLLVCRRQPGRVRRSMWGEEAFLDRLHAEGIVPYRDSVVAALDGYAATVDSLHSGGLFHLAELLAFQLTPDAADEGLNYGFDLLEDAMRPQDGDGPWRDGLQPPASCTEALAGYIWAGLGSPRVAERWTFAHVVRTWVELGWSGELRALVGFAARDTASPFVDAGLEFYSWHARLWFLIGLARGALARPIVLLPLVPFLRECAVETHILIRAFAADALRALNAANLLAVDEAVDWEKINHSPLALDVYTGWRDMDPDQDAPDETGLDEEDEYYFGIDIRPYWFAPLGNAFGLTEETVESHARVVLHERLGVRANSVGQEARYTRQIFDDRETGHSHGTLPKTDDLRAYHAFHAMMFVAARLLATRPVRKRADEPENEFQNWLQKYLLSRVDGRWLADRRDPRLVPDPGPVEHVREREWRWQVSTDDLDRHLRSDDGLQVLWGNWRSAQDYANESVSVRSALVARVEAEALLAGLQTSLDFDQFSLPSSEMIEVVEPRGRLTGWVDPASGENRLDEADPWAVELSHPAIRPDEATIAALGLSPTADERSWRTADSEVLLRSESWGDVVRFGRDTDTVTGTRLSGSRDFVAHLLESHPEHCLILSSSIRRQRPRYTRDRDDFADYPQPYVRYYLMDSDGVPRPF